MLCPCKSNKAFEQCCQPIIIGVAKAYTPEELMRSRYCAYAIGNGQYIVNTYSQSTRTKQSISDIQMWADKCEWINLIIHSAVGSTVEFSAYFIEDKQLYILREKSEFILEDTAEHNENWYYHTGEIIENLSVDKVKRNESCPCLQNKKFKQCCGPLLA